MKNDAPENSGSGHSKTDGSHNSAAQFAKIIAGEHSDSSVDDFEKTAVAIDGPSGSGKNTLFKHFKSLTGAPDLSVLDTNVFMEPRSRRNDDERHSLFRNWYRVDAFKANLAKFLDSDQAMVIDQAYIRDPEGTASHSLAIPPGRLRILMGRYALHPEIQSVFESRSIATKKVIIDAPQPLRLNRIRQRASAQQHRTQDEQEELIQKTVDPDWFGYFPLIFPTADWYVVNYTNSDSEYRKPKDCVDRSHVWGAFANLHVQPERILRLIEIGANGATSTHRHENSDETYFHVLGGPLGVTLGRGADETRHILVPGESITVPHGVYHRAWAVNDSPPVYYETVLPVNGSRIDHDDIQRLREAKPMSQALSYFGA